MQYLSEIKTKDINKELSYKIKFETEQNYSISLIIKIVNESQSVKDEKYYSVPLSFNTKKDEFLKRIIKIIVISLAIVLIIIILLILFFCIRKKKKKNINHQGQFKTFSFTSEIEEDIGGEIEKPINDDKDENAFI